MVTRNHEAEKKSQITADVGAYTLFKDAGNYDTQFLHTTPTIQSWLSSFLCWLCLHDRWLARIWFSVRIAAQAKHQTSTRADIIERLHATALKRRPFLGEA